MHFVKAPTFSAACDALPAPIREGIRDGYQRGRLGFGLRHSPDRAEIDNHDQPMVVIVVLRGAPSRNRFADSINASAMRSAETHGGRSGSRRAVAAAAPLDSAKAKRFIPRLASPAPRGAGASLQAVKAIGGDNKKTCLSRGDLADLALALGLLASLAELDAVELVECSVFVQVRAQRVDRQPRAGKPDTTRRGHVDTDQNQLRAPKVLSRRLRRDRKPRVHLLASILVGDSSRFCARTSSKRRVSMVAMYSFRPPAWA